MASLSIKNVPDEVVQILRRQAVRNHRSLQGELLSIVTANIEPVPFDAEAFIAESRRLGFSTPEQSVEMIREDRDGADSRR